MRSTLRLPLIAISVVALASPAFAADPGWYTGLRGGASAIDDMKSTGAANMTLDPKTGWMIEGTVGYRFSSPFRVALEAGYHDNALRGTFQENVIPLVACGTAQPCLGSAVRGGISGPSVFGMAYYDIPLSERLTLSLGGGVGAQRIDVTAHTLGTQNGVTSRYNLIDAGDTVFAGRGSAELAYAMGTRTDLTLGYTYTRTAEASLPGNGAYVPFTFADNMSSHAFKAGVKLAF